MQIGVLDLVAIGITALFAVKGNKLKLSRILLMALTLVLVLTANKLLYLGDIQNNDLQNTLIVMAICYACFLVASNVMQKFLDKVVDTFISPSLNALIGTVVSSVIGLILASMVCFLAVKAKPDIKTSNITQFYLNIAEVVIAKAPEIANDVKEKAMMATETVDENVPENKVNPNTVQEVPSDIAKTIEELQTK